LNTVGQYEIYYYHSTNIAWCLVIQPEVLECMEATVGDIKIPVEVIGSDIHPRVELETLNVSR